MKDSGGWHLEGSSRNIDSEITGKYTVIKTPGLHQVAPGEERVRSEEGQ